MVRITWGIVLAGGEGRRFGQPKQFERIGGRRLVDYSVATVREVCDGVTVVLPEAAWDGEAVDAVAAGGASRAASVRRGLEAVPRRAEYIVVHDAAHPLASAALLRSVLSRLTEGFDAVAPIKPLTDPLKRVVDGQIVGTVPREGVWTTQSPAAFRAEPLRAAYADASRDSLEDLILIEEAGGRIGTVAGDLWNIHVTTRKDLEIARFLMDERVSKCAP